MVCRPPIVKEGLLTPEHNKETLLSWSISIPQNNFLEYRNAFIGPVKGFSKVFKQDLSDGEETIVISIGLYPEQISAEKPLNLNYIFKTAKQNLQEFIKLKQS